MQKHTAVLVSSTIC